MAIPKRVSTSFDGRRVSVRSGDGYQMNLLNTGVTPQPSTGSDATKSSRPETNHSADNCSSVSGSGSWADPATGISQKARSAGSYHERSWWDTTSTVASFPSVEQMSRVTPYIPTCVVDRASGAAKTAGGTTKTATS